MDIMNWFGLIFWNMKTIDKQLFNLKLDDITIINPMTFLNEMEE